ncbi:MAG: GGDEF domain-containing protein [Anaerolineaceae bacterium]|nr:GGDEF domain-containing protein [Anaerolineaceae bacterium]
MPFSPSNIPHRKQLLARTVRWLGKPAEGMPEPERRRNHVLAWMQITLILLIGLALVLNLLFINGNTPRDRLYNFLMAGLLVGLLAAFGLNRRGRYRASSYMTVFLAFLGPWSSLLGDSTVLQGDFVPLTYLVLPVILASILLSVGVTIILAGLQFGLLIFLPYFIPAIASINWVSFMIFIFFVSILGAVSNFIHRQDLQQIDEATGLLQESEAQLRELSVRDALTGLFNRRYLEETLEREIHRVERKGLSLGIIMLDLDHFKRINDTYGHPAGDVALQALGSLLKANIRVSDIACRYGGEEFVLILPEASLEVTRQRAERLCLNVKKLNVSYNELLLEPITLSLGVAAFPEHGSTYMSLLSAVDAAMYHAKNEGRDRVVVARDEKQRND